MQAKILIVDDEPNVLNALERVLRREDYEIIKANGGREALEAIEKHDDIAIIISDQLMPDVSGLEVLKAARYKRPDALRIGLTGVSDMDTILSCINEARVTQFLLKPWDDELLLQVVCETVTIYWMKHEKNRLHGEANEKSRKLEDANMSLENRVAGHTSALMRTQQQLEKTLHDIVGTLSELMEMHSVGMRGHGKRVAELSRGLAEALKLPGDEIRDIVNAAMFHDIGKIAVPTELLGKKTDRLSLKDKKLIQRHSQVGFEILKGISGFEKVARMVKHHHEETAGNGYPDRLVGDDIPLGARVIAVADMFDKSMFPTGMAVIGSSKNAEAKIARAAGRILDGCLVDLFIEVVLPGSSAMDHEEIEVPAELLKPGMALSRDLTDINGVTLLKAHTVLELKMIEKVLRKEEFDPVLSRIFINQRSMPHEDQPDDQEQVIPSDVPQAGQSTEKPVSRAEAIAGNVVETAREIGIEEANPVKARPKVVVVDDQPHIVHALRRELKSGGYDVAGFTSANDAISYIRKEKNIYAVISDYLMPGVRGDKFIEILQEERPELPCIIVTGQATQETVNNLTKSGHVTRIIPKPWDKEALLKTLDEMSQESKQKSVSHSSVDKL